MINKFVNYIFIVLSYFSKAIEVYYKVINVKK